MHGGWAFVEGVRQRFKVHGGMIGQLREVLRSNSSKLPINHNTNAKNPLKECKWKDGVSLGGISTKEICTSLYHKVGWMQDLNVRWKTFNYATCWSKMCQRPRYFLGIVFAIGVFFVWVYANGCTT